MGALDDVKVLDLSRLLPGGFCSMLLADFGADVLKVEDTGMGDYVRWSIPKYEGADETASSAYFLALNRGKKSIRINLKEPEGQAILLKLIKDYDVVLESFRPGVLDRLGVGYERMKQENPKIVYCAITGYGQDGPHRDRSGHDMNYLGLIGLLGLTGDKDGPPVQSAGQIADLGGGGLMGAFGGMAAVHERGRPRRGPMGAGAVGGGEVPRRGEQQLAGGLVCYLPYEASDGWVTCGALEPKFWAAFCNGVERPELVEKQFEAPGTDAWREIAEVFR